MQIRTREFILYKTINSLFSGISLGSIFILYQPLPPVVFSIGGIVLSVATLLVSLLYKKLLNIKWFFIISLFIEVLLLAVIIAYLLLGLDFIMALTVYCVYEVSFIFGSYLVRAESMFLSESGKLTRLDSMKQVGYLLGMGMSSLFFWYHANLKPIDQVYILHYSLLFIQSTVVLLIVLSFKATYNEKSKDNNHSI